MLVRVALEVELRPLRDQALTAFATTVLDDATTGLRLHARAKTVLLFAASLGWLVRPFHG